MEHENGYGKYAVFASKSGIFAVKAKMFVDCTGDGDLAVMCGANFIKGDEEGNLMPGTLCSAWAGVDWNKFEQSARRPREFLQEAFKDGVFRVNDPHHPGMWRTGHNLTGGNIGHTFGVDSTDEKSLTEALLEGRKQLPEFEYFYKHYVPGYENIELVTSGSLLGIRESRRIIGDYVLNLQDYLDRRSFRDEIGRYCYQVDIHISKPNMDEYAKFEKDFHTLICGKGESYGIPYRILTPENLNNVLVAGRCVSSDRYVQSSIRVMPGCFITGQAAGAAAALAAGKNIDSRQVPYDELKDRLRKLSAFIPENVFEKQELASVSV
jgi:hypothetical protein